MESLNNTQLRVSNLSKSYKDVKALNKVSFDVKKGEFLAILGPSGCGKTTLLRILIGLLESDSGTVFKDGQDITNLDASKRGMGIVFQNYALFENMTVFENIEYALKINKDLKATSKDVTNDLISQMDLEEHKNKKPGALSGGQQQRVAIARTLALNPEIILLDEPMSALDVDTRLRLREEIKDIQKKFNTTMIYITHDQEEAFAMADRIMVMRDGNIEQIDTPEKIIEGPASEYIEDFVIKNLKLKIKSLVKYVKLWKKIDPPTF